ncbi:MAG: hypothetical protein JW729_01510 [Bacteroidales bacterium]|nr:hypothetical protein [Bacteroidales bacterium]
MSITLDQAKQIAPKCPHNYLCVSNPDFLKGEIEYVVNNTVLFVIPENGHYCPYLNHFGNSHFCTCKIRMMHYQNAKSKN